MSTLLQLQQELSHKTLTIKDIVARADKAEGGPRNLTQDELDAFDRLTGEVGKLKEQIAAVEATNRRREQAEKLIEDIERPAGRVTPPEQPATGAAASTPTAIMRVPATARRTGILKAFKPRQGERPEDADLRAYRAGLWARAVLFRDERAASKCMSNGIAIPNNAMSTTSNPDGGFLVPDEMSQAIIDMREQYGVFRQNCRVWPMGSDTLMIPRRAGGVTVGALGENPAAAPSSSTPTFNMVQLVAKKCGGLSIISSEIAEDAVIDLADWISAEWGYAFALFEDQCGFIGDGTSTYLGIRGINNYLTEANVTSYIGAVPVATATHDTFAELDATDIATLMSKLPQYAKVNAKFYCSSVCAELVFNRLKATAGGNTVQTLGGAPGDNYLGYPIVISQVLPSVTTTLDALPMLLFGDLSKSSSLGDRRQVRVFPSFHRYMELDQVGILATERIDIINHDLGDGTTAGPIVALTGSSS